MTTVPDLDELRGRYTLDTEAICSYELGGGGGDAALPPRVPGDVEADLRAELAKMQGVILSIHEGLLAQLEAGGRELPDMFAVYSDAMQRLADVHESYSQHIHVAFSHLALQLFVSKKLVLFLREARARPGTRLLSFVDGFLSPLVHLARYSVLFTAVAGVEEDHPLLGAVALAGPTLAKCLHAG